MQSIAKGIAAAAMGFMAFGGVAFADTVASADAQKALTTPSVTGSIASEPTFAQRMKDCMSIWDKGTHMTKEQWRRSCKTTLQSLTTN